MSYKSLFKANENSVVRTFNNIRNRCFVELQVKFSKVSKQPKLIFFYNCQQDLTILNFLLCDQILQLSIILSKVIGKRNLRLATKFFQDDSDLWR